MMPVLEEWDGHIPAPQSEKTATAQPELSTTYKKILSDLDFQIDSWNRNEFFTHNLKPLFDEIAPEELAAHKDDLLRKAVDCNASDVIALLLKRFPDTPFDFLQEMAITGAEKEHTRSLRTVLEAAEKRPQYLDLLLLLNEKRDSYPGDTQSALKSIRHSYLGSAWRVLNANEISKTTQANTTTLERVFNFQAMNITTIATISGKSPAVSVTDRNFNECQSDAEIAEAHEKLALFEKNAPAYRGKNVQTQRRVQKRERTARNV